jgi:hypothetical protein
MSLDRKTPNRYIDVRIHLKFQIEFSNAYYDHEIL